MSITDVLEETSRKYAKKNMAGDTVINGIMIGVVIENNNKKFPGMVRVQVPTRDDKRNILQWMKVISVMSGKTWGGYFIPEIGEEVVIAFEDGNINNAYVIGSIFKNDSEILSQNYTEENFKKIFITKGKNQILIDDETDKQKVLVNTNSGQSIEINDEDKLISITDKQKKNLIEMKTEDGVINIKSESKLTIDINGTKIEISGDTGKIIMKADSINIEAEQSINIKGQTIKMSSSNFNVNSSGSAKVNSDGMVQIKGNVVKLG